jgi:ribonuclease HI
LSSDKGLKIPAPCFQNKVDESHALEEATIFTDGSKKDLDCGSGFILKWNDQTRMGLTYNGKFYTVFLSKVRAIVLAVEKILAEKIKSPIVKIYSDCQSAILSILSSHSNSKTVQFCWSQLHTLDSNCKWSISWVKAHVGNSGNEAADKLAKQGTTLSFHGPQPFLPIAPVHIKNALESFHLKIGKPIGMEDLIADKLNYGFQTLIRKNLKTFLT